MPTLEELIQQATPIFGGVYRSKLDVHQRTMWLAYLYGQLGSKDPKRKVGAVILEPKSSLMAFGYNGFPRGLPDRVEIWDNAEKTSAPSSKNAYAIHAEEQAIAQARRMGLNGRECHLYVTRQPCGRCANLVADFGISTIYYLEDEADAVASSVFSFYGTNVMKLQLENTL